VCIHICQMHQNLKLLAASLPAQKDCRFSFKNVMCSRESQNCTLQKYSDCPGQNHLKTVIQELFQANDFDVKDTIVYR
jgi:hypothetical protein